MLPHAKSRHDDHLSWAICPLNEGPLTAQTAISFRSLAPASPYCFLVKSGNLSWYFPWFCSLVRSSFFLFRATIQVQSISHRQDTVWLAYNCLAVFQKYCTTVVICSRSSTIERLDINRLSFGHIDDRVNWLKSMEAPNLDCGGQPIYYKYPRRVWNNHLF